MSLIVNHADITTGQVLNNLGNCRNTTVGDKLYQLYCVTRSNIVGSCVTLPSRYYPSGEINCFTVTSQSFLRKIYSDTGNACAINCYYRTTLNIPTIDVPTIDVPTFSDPTYTFSSHIPDSPTFTPLVPVARSSSSSASSFTPVPTTNSDDNGDLDLDLDPGLGSDPNMNAGINMYPNFMLSLVAILTLLMIAFRRTH